MQGDFSDASQSQVKKWARLPHTKFRREDGLLMAEGVKVVGELLKSDWPLEALLVLPEKKHNWENTIKSACKQIPVYQLQSAAWQRLSQDKEPEGLMAVVRLKEPLALSTFIERARGHILILHAINNPGNLGALARSAHWFGFAGILLGSDSVDWTNPKVIRSSMGSIFHLPILADVDLLTTLAIIKQNFLLIGSDVRQGVLPHPPPKKAALLLGNESHGLPEELLKQVDEHWRIPGNSQADSLSLPQAAAIMMYEVGRNTLLGN